jgi:hypothetical protein
MVISPQNRRLGLIALTKRVGLTDRPDASDGDLIRYRVNPHFKQYFVLWLPLLVCELQVMSGFLFYILD